jgi:hypothetical protein
MRVAEKLDWKGLNVPNKSERAALIIIYVQSSQYAAFGNSPKKENIVKDLLWCEESARR